jgi:hypothetical protein
MTQKPFLKSASELTDDEAYNLQLEHLQMLNALKLCLPLLEEAKNKDFGKYWDAYAAVKVSIDMSKIDYYK